MANMNFGVNILPNSNNTYSLGNSDKKWNAYINQVNGSDINQYIRTSSASITADLGTVTGTGSSTTVTKTVTGITSDMTPDRVELGTPAVILSDMTITTATNSVTFTAIVNGSTTVKIKFSNNTNVTGT